MFTFVKAALVSTFLVGSWAAPIPKHLYARQGCSAEGGHCATYYDVGLGACGNYNSDSEWVVAMNHVEWDGGSPCGRMVQITASTGKTATAKVVDLCPGCGVGSLDLSRPVFEAISNNGLTPGVIPISWQYIGGGGWGTSGNSGNSGTAGGAVQFNHEKPAEPSPQPAWIPDSSAAEQPAWTPSTSSEQPAWTPSSSPEQPAWTPSSSPGQPAWSEPAPAWTPTSSTAAAQSSTPASTVEESQLSLNAWSPPSHNAWSQPPAESSASTSTWNDPAATSSGAGRQDWYGEHRNGNGHGWHGKSHEGWNKHNGWHNKQDNTPSSSESSAPSASPAPAAEWNHPAAFYAEAEPAPASSAQVEQPSAQPAPQEEQTPKTWEKQDDVQPGADVDCDDAAGSDLPWCD